MPLFYVTFGWKSPFRNGWVEIECDNEETARKEIMYALGGGKAWSGLYPEADFTPAFFTAGRLGERIVLPSGYVHPTPTLLEDL